MRTELVISDVLEGLGRIEEEECSPAAWGWIECAIEDLQSILTELDDDED